MGEAAEETDNVERKATEKEEIVRGPGVEEGVIQVSGGRVWDLALALLSGGQARTLSSAMELAAQQMAFFLHEPQVETRVRKDMVTRTSKGGRKLSKMPIRIELEPTVDVGEDASGLWDEPWELTITLETPKLIRSIS